MAKRLKKFTREKKENLPRREITDRSIKIVDALNRYKFLPTSLLVRVVGGNHRITKRHLQNLYHRELVNRFAFPSVGFPSEFVYYLDSRSSLQLLKNHGFAEDTLDERIIKNNRDKRYFKITESKNSKDLQGRLMHLNHELMISRFHFLLEKACEKTNGKVVLAGFFQGSRLWNRVKTSKYIYDDPNNRIIEIDQEEYIPHRPDAFFALYYPDKEKNRTDYYFYEADRKTTSVKKHNRKLRGHFHYTVKQKLHREDYGIKRIKAVLIESIDSSWADNLRRAARHPVVSGSKPSPLFWFSTSEFFTRPVEVIEEGKPRTKPVFMEQPEIVFNPIWATPLHKKDDVNFKSILNLEDK